MNNKKIAIFTAVDIETRAIRRAIRPTTYAVYTIGIGAGHLPTSFDMRGVTAIVLCGLAGALDPALKVGDLILDDPDGIIPAAAPFRRGEIHSADRIVATPADKLILVRKHQAMAVDMEKGKVQRYATQLGIPMVNIRAISDTAQETLDPRVRTFVNELGKPQRMVIALTLLRQPRLIPYLLQLNANTKLALRTLGPAVKSIANHLMKSEVAPQKRRGSETKS